MEVLLIVLGVIVGVFAGAFAGWRFANGVQRPSGELATLVSPLRDSLEAVQVQLDQAERGRLASDVSLREQVRSMAYASDQLRGEANRLVTALRAPQVRGRWGELHLERVVEAAGLTEHIDFRQQVTTDGDGGRVRPDLVVELTNGRRIVVDSKVPLMAYLEAIDAADEAGAEAQLLAHARQLRRHVDSLAAKAYWQQLEPTPEFVVCFVPADAFLDAALARDRDLLEDAFSRNVVLATPSTLVALLRTVAYTWRQQELAANANQVHELGKELYQRLTRLGAHFDKLGRSLGGAVEAYNDAVGSMERRVLTKARQLQALGVVDSTTSLPPLTPLPDAVPRPLTSPELAG